MVIQHAVDDRRRIVASGNYPARPWRYAVVAGEVDAREVDGLIRRRAGHGADVNTGDDFRAAADHFEVQVIVEGGHGSVFPLQQL